ncbi:MAG: RNA methyltransferase [Eubacteriales bacterium]|nr:RNA methyltransferase [Eubacteriales bacterium]
MNIITDFNDKRIDMFARLTENELSHFNEPVKEGFFVAESPNVIMRALEGGYEPVMFLAEDRLIESFGDVFKLAGDVPVFTAPIGVLSQMIGYQLARGLLCLMKRKPLPKACDIVKDARRIAILEDVMNPTNVGAIFRSAAALGIDAVLLTKGSSDPLYRRSARVSMGTVFQVPWTFIDDVTETARETGFKTVAMALKQDSISIADERLSAEPRLAVVLGTESEGLKESTIASCDYTAMIPMKHGVDSLNVAAAGAVIFWELCK